MTEKEKEYPWEKYTREEKAQINLHRAKLTPEDFEEWYRTRNI
jgi:hypothetical protein